MEDLYNIYGPHNAHWVQTFIQEALNELGIQEVTPFIKQIIERVLSRLFSVVPGTPIGLLIAFELSKTTSQLALDSGHILDSMSEQGDDASALYRSFQLSVSFTGIISQRKMKDVNFIHCLFKPNINPTWVMLDTDIYAVPIKEIAHVMTLTRRIFFITQPYKFPNEFIGLINIMNMYSYLAKRDQLLHLLPLFHILALISSEFNPPSPFNRHGLKQRKVNFVTRAAFEDVLSAILDASLDQQQVSSESIISALVTATRSKTGSTYFDILQHISD